MLDVLLQPIPNPSTNQGGSSFRLSPASKQSSHPHCYYLNPRHHHLFLAARLLYWPPKWSSGLFSPSSQSGPINTKSMSIIPVLKTLQWFPTTLGEVKSLSRVQLFVTPRTVAYQAFLSMGFSRKEYWSGLPSPSLGDLPNPGIEPGSPTLQADALPSEPPGKPSSKSQCTYQVLQNP